MDFFAPFSGLYSGLRLTNTQISNSSNNPYATSIGFGSGTTPVQESDYMLESMITSGLSFVSTETELTNSTTVNEDKTEITRTATLKMAVKNTSSSQIRISEIGFYQSMKTTNYTLLHREVLDEPITLEAGAIATFSYEFTFTNSIA